jgi:hypothetical protein
MNWLPERLTPTRRSVSPSASTSRLPLTLAARGAEFVGRRYRSYLCKEALAWDTDPGRVAHATAVTIAASAATAMAIPASIRPCSLSRLNNHPFPIDTNIDAMRPVCVRDMRLFDACCARARHARPRVELGASRSSTLIGASFSAPP